MALFDELRQQMSAKYGKKKKKEEEPLLPVAGDSSSAGAKTSFDSMRKNLSKKYNPAADVDTDYIDSFLRDSSDFLKSAETDYNSMTPDTSSQIYASRHKASEDLNKRRTAIKSFLEQNRDRLDPKAYGDLAKYLDDFAGASGQLGYVFYDANRQLNYDNPYNRLRLYNTMQDRLKTIETEMKTATGDNNKALKDEKKKLEDSVRQYERTQYKADSYSTLYKKKDFARLSSKRDFNTPTREEFRENDVRLDSGSWYYDAGGKLYNAMGEAVEDGDIYTSADGSWKLKNNGNVDRLGVFLNATEDEYTDAVGKTGSWEKIINDGLHGSWDMLTKKEINAYYYLLNTEGYEAADKFLEDMTPELNRRTVEQTNENIKKAVENGNILGNAALGAYSVITKPLGNMAAAADDALSLILEGEINPYSTAHELMNTANQIRGSQAEAIDKATGGAKIPILDYSAGEAYQAAMSTLDTMTSKFTGAGLYSAQMAAGAFSDKVTDLYLQGASKTEIASLGAIAAAAEYYFEKFSIDRLIHIGDSKTLSQILKNTLMQGGIEESEEMLTEATNIIADGIIRGGASEWNKLLEESDGNVLLALGKEVQQIGKAGFSGFISGMLAGGVASAGNYVQNQIETHQIGKKSDLKAIEGKLDGMIADPELDGDTKKLLEAVREDIKSGKIDTDKIEQIFGGDKYTVWKDADRKESELIEEYEKLADTPSMELSRNQQKRLDELEGQLENLRGKTESNRLYGELTGYVSEQIDNSKLKDSKLNDIYNDKVSRRTKFTADVSKYSSEAARRSIQNLIDTGYANNSKETHEFADNVAKLAERTGKVFSFVNNEQIREMGKAVEGRRVNGFVTEDGIAVNLDSRKAWEFVVGHEVTHVIEGLNSYTELHDALKEYATQRGEWDGRLKELTELYEGQDADVEAELVADLVGEYLFGDTDFISSLAAKNPNVFQKIYAEIKHLLKTVTAGSKQARQLERAKYAFEKAMRESGKAKVEGTEYSLGYDYSISFEQQIDDYKKGIIPAGDTLLIGKTPDVYLSIGLNALPMTINTSHVDYALKGTKDADHFLDETLLKQLPESIKNPVAVFVSATHPNNSIIALLPFTVNGKQTVAPVRVDGFGKQNGMRIDSNTIVTVFGKTNSVTKQLYDAIIDEANGKFSLLYWNKKEAVSLLQRAGLQLPGSPIPRDGFIHSIRENDSPVKYKFKNVTESQQFIRWFGDWKNNSKNASKIVNEDGTPRIVYHQTDRDFSVFDNSTPVAGKNDSETPNGFFFKDNDHDIGLGGSKQMAVYLDMKNPLRFASREDANQWYCQNISGYASLQNEMNEALSPISTEMDNIENEMFSDEVTDEQYEILDQKWNELLDKMKSVENDFRGRLRKLLDDYFINGSSGYDGIILDYDGHRYVNGVREDVKTYIVFKRTQIKSATDNIGTYDGSNPDINYSLSYENEADANADKRLNNADDTVPVREDAARVQDTDRMPPVREDAQTANASEAAEDVPITTVRERLENKKANYESELESNRTNRAQAWANYDDAIAQAQAQYDDLKNKDTKKANKLLRRIDRLKRQQANVDADYEKRISDIESRIGRTSEKIELNEQRKAQLASDIASLNMPTQERESSGKIAKSLTKESGVNQKKKQRGILSLVKEYVLDNGMVFEDESKKHHNRQLEADWNMIRNARSMAQRFLKKSVNGRRSIVDIEAEVRKKGLTQDFYDYMHHMLNVDRMSLESKAQAKIADIIANNPVLSTLLSRNQSTGDILNDPLFKQNADTLKADVDKILKLKETKNHPVFGDPITSEISAEEAAKLEKAHPEFKSYAEEIYANNRELRDMLVEEGIITPETAQLWEEMYPHYVPIRRAKKSNGSGEYGRRQGVNAPLKRAEGGNTDIEPIFNTIALRAEQTYKAVLKNRFGVELMNTIQTPIVEADNKLGGKIDTPDGVENIDSLLMPGDGENAPTFTVFENGERVTFEITEEMYDAMRPTGDALSYTSKGLQAVSNLMRSLLTEYNLPFMAGNAIKDAQDILMNSQHPARTYAAIPKAIAQIASKGKYLTEYMDYGGQSLSFFDKQKMEFVKKNVPKEVFMTLTGLNAISKANNVVELMPRLAEYIASREAGRSIEISMLDAARVTTNFAAGGKLTKLVNRNGATFLNASVQGFMQNVRNIREAKMNGLKGWAGLAARTILAGVPALILNNLIWDDDDEYEELSDYIKQNYYIVGKFGDGKFVRIPKGRTVAVIQDAFMQMSNAITGDDEVDFESFAQLVINNLVPNNPYEDNVASPIVKMMMNETWYGGDLVPTRLQDSPKAEQYDETTDAISKWLGEKLNFSPYKINYLLDQYTGGIGDILLPMITPESETGDDSVMDYVTAPFRDKFTTDSVLKNQNVSDFYDLKDELNVNANSSKATDDDTLKNKYMNAMGDRISELQKQKREIQARNDLSKSEKYDMTRDLQKEIVALTKEAIDSYENLNQVDGNHTEIGGYYYEWYTPEEGEPYWRKMTDSQKTKYLLTKDADGHYVTDGNVHYRLDEDGKWTKISDKDLARQNEVTKELGITPDEYWSKTETSFFPVKNGEYEYAYENPEKYTVAKAVGGYDAYKSYSKELSGIKADKGADGKVISGSRKEKVLDYINGLDIDYGEKIILFKNEYNADDTYNYDIINYLNSRDDISYSEMETILKELGFDVDSEGNVSW